MVAGTAKISAPGLGALERMAICPARKHHDLDSKNKDRGCPNKQVECVNRKRK